MTKSLENLRRDAKALKKAHASGEADALARVGAVLPDVETLKHADALHVIARENGAESWPKLKLATEIAAMDRAARAERLKIALYRGQTWVVERLLTDDPELAHANFGLQVALYREDAVAQALARDPSLVNQPVAGPRTPILHLTFSQHWRTSDDGADASIRLAQLLVAHGADVNDSYPSEPGSEHPLSALYGAVGHAGNVALARWLLENGADPDDNESLYHATELDHLDGVRLLLEHGATIEGTNALFRMLDFDSYDGVKLFLDHGANPNERINDHPSGQPAIVISALHQAARRRCSGDVARLLIEHGADGTTKVGGHSAYALARMRGSHGVARALEEAGQATDLDPLERLLARAAEGPVEGRIAPEAITTRETRLLIGRLLGFDAPRAHVERLVELGLDPNEKDEMGMPAIHMAAWEGHADAVEFLLGCDPDLNHKNDYGGDLMGTVIHGAEFCPARDRRDHLRAAMLILEAGAPLHRYDARHCGAPELAEYLTDWADAHPDRVIEDAGNRA